MSLGQEIRQKAQRAKEASRRLALATSREKDQALRAMAEALRQEEASLLRANREDLEAARGTGRTSAFLDRLALDPKRIEGMARALEGISQLPDPVGEVTEITVRPNGLRVGRMRVPLGVVGVIYESRPSVTAEAAGLCLKSGNAVILRGGKEARASNTAIARILTREAEGAGLPEACIMFIENPDRSAILELARLPDLVDLLIPRGGPELIRFVVENSTIPVIRHEKGICHLFVDEDANLAMAEEIAFNAKVERPGVCNAMETLLVHEKIAPSFLPALAKRLEEAGVELRGCARSRALHPSLREASDSDWDAEYLDLILSIRVVEGMEEAMEHIAQHGSGLAEAIVTENYSHVLRFLQGVDSSCVFVNASTRFADGGEFGMGAEIGISTQKLHARGPMGLRELTCTKFIILGQGQIRISRG
ncbi:MAG: glutamate-5-semialdehyde dehydrogenase [candidate division NC10 bacterium]|nr:glutamate-5-semialdehyde dehydrogenase [candidate division NC10 bacterium]